MRGKLKKWEVIILVMSLILFVFIGSSEAFYPYLNDEQIEEAIQYGKDNREIKLDEEWEVSLGYGLGFALLQSPFSTLANRSRQAAKQYRSVTDHEKEIALSGEGRLDFAFYLSGDSITFGKNYHAVLLYEGKYIQPIKKENEEFADWDETASKYYGVFLYYFPLVSTVDKEEVSIDPNGKITLIAISPEGEETRFEFDLSKIR